MRYFDLTLQQWCEGEMPPIRERTAWPLEYEQADPAPERQAFPTGYRRKGCRDCGPARPAEELLAMTLKTGSPSPP